ncbi:MAG: adenosine deaminase [Rubrivivax sp.]|nr:adenosine deaminase [Rubrivivax sp.]
MSAKDFDTPAETLDPLRIARAMPKVLLHDHLDGSLRESTLMELMQQRGMRSPAPDLPSLVRWFDARAHAGSLEEFLRGFALTVEAMASPAALERVAFECAEDAREEGCVLAEFRIAPLLFEPYGVSGDAAVEALLAGLSRSELPSGLIVCAMRNHGEETVRRSVELALRWRDRGVVAFDLAGPERGWPATPFAALLQQARDGGLGLTLHAGEADSAERVLEAARLGATRIGHGIQLAERIGAPDWPQTLAWLRERAVHLEICPTSNVQTGGTASLAAHPIRALWDAGVSLSFHTDNRLMSRISASSEAAALVQEAGFGWDELKAMGEAAARATFLGESARRAALAALAGWTAPTR